MSTPNDPRTPTSTSTFAASTARRAMLAMGLLLAAACAPEPELELEGEPPRARQAEGIAQLSVGSATTCAVTTLGNVKCWGRNDRGQLGRGDTITIGDDETLDTIGLVDLGGPALRIHTNGAQTLALMQDGTVRSWGRNGAFELGLLHTSDIGDDETPAQAGEDADPILGGEVVQVALGQGFGCARLDDGAVRCWGSNAHGQLGYGHTETIGDDELPMDAGTVSLDGPAVELAAGAQHVCALLEGGTLTCWGRGTEGQLGYGDLESVGGQQLPVEAGAVDVGGVVVQVVAGALHTCARLDDGAIRCWGDDRRGQLGYGTSNAVGGAEPVTLGDVPLGGPALELAAGAEHTCAVLATGQLRCWGANEVGQLGQGHASDIGDDETPQEVGAVDLGGRMVEAVFMGTGARSTCVRLEGGALRCWGGNESGQLGQGHTLSLGDEPGEVPGNLPDIVILDGDDDS